MQGLVTIIIIIVHDGKELTATRQGSSPSTIWSALALIFALQHLRSNLNTLPKLSRRLQHSSSSFSTSSIVHNRRQNQLTLPPRQAIPTLKRKQLFDYLVMMLLIFGSKMFGIIKIISIMILILTITHLAPAGQPAPGITPSEAALLPPPPPSVEQILWITYWSNIMRFHECWGRPRI